MAAGIYVGFVFTTAPKIDTDDIYSMLAQRSVMYDSDGNEIENLYFSDGNRTVVDYDEIPEDMVNAVVSIEDKKFWSHNGFNFVRMLGAVKDSIFGGGQISGYTAARKKRVSFGNKKPAKLEQKNFRSILYYSTRKKSDKRRNNGSIP